MRISASEEMMILAELQECGKRAQGADYFGFELIIHTRFQLGVKVGVEASNRFNGFPTI
jgi:hypothetical protein